MKNIKIISPAKINLNLKIGNIKKNNLHEIESKMHTINLFDEIEITKIPKSGRQKIVIKIDGKQKKGVPSNSENIVYKSAEIFFKETNIKDSIEIKINKNIPNKSGLGGASSNAANTIKALEEIFNKKINDKKILKICHKLGSDVPFFYFGAPHAFVNGTGEKIEKLEPEKFYCCLAILPKIQIQTSWAFGRFDKFKNKSHKELDNDFENVIFNFFPDLENLKNEFLKYKVKKAGLTGSGSAIYAIFKENNLFKEYEEKTMSKYDFFWKGESLQK